ncbi:MAG: hypothetical protein F6K11_38160 [Leptolyngbya sp. SIO3F4]|nr:hypothetical protein [Leptolyngbya sp. SIO3F4]
MTFPSSETDLITGLDSWTQRLTGVIQLAPEESTNSYVDYLEEKYS